MRSLRLVNKILHLIMPRDEADVIFDEILKSYTETPDCIFFQEKNGAYHSINSVKLDDGNDIILS